MRYDMTLRGEAVCVERRSKSHRKYRIVGNCAITQALHIGCLYLRHLHTHNSFHIPVESIVYPHDNNYTLELPH